MQINVYGKQHLSTDKCKRRRNSVHHYRAFIFDSTSLHDIHFGHYIIPWHSFWTLHSQLWHTPLSSFDTRGNSPDDQHHFSNVVFV